MEVEKNLEDDVNDGVGNETTTEPVCEEQNSLKGVKTRRSSKKAAAAAEDGKIMAKFKEATPNGDVNMLDKDDVSSEETTKMPPEESEDAEASGASSPKDGSGDDEPENEESDAEKNKVKSESCDEESNEKSGDETEVKSDVDADENQSLPSKETKLPSKESEKPIKVKNESSANSKPAKNKGNEEEGEDDDDDVGSDSDAEALAEIVKSKQDSKTIKVEKSEKSESGNSAASRTNKDQTIIITETKSLAQAINDAVKQPDGKPTLVIIETKSPTTTSVGSNGVVTSSTSSAGAKAAKVTARQVVQQPYQNSLRSALLQGSFGMSTRGQGRPMSTNQQSPTKAATKADGSQGIALQDDAEVNVYTPSLLVPYLFESPPKESLSEFLRKIAPPEVVKAEEEKLKKEQEEIDNCEIPLTATPKKTFFDLALGQFFVDIGLSQAQQWVQTEILKSQKKKLDKGWKTKERENMVRSLQRNLAEVKTKNKPFTFQMKKCRRCNFLTESQTILDHHLETIHVIGLKMFCSYCEFTTIEASQIFHHLYIQHKAFGRLERPPTIHMCPVCPFEDTAKARVTRHMWKCLKAFVPEKNMAPPNDFEPPAKRLRHLASVATLKAMRAGVERETAAVNAAALAQQRQAAANSLLSLSPLLAQGRGGPQPIRPKPGDLRLTPTYVQSVLRGAYGNPPVSVRGLTPAVTAQSMSPHAVMRTAVPVRSAGPPQAHSQGAYLTSRQQNTSTITPVSASPTFSLHGNQLYQVVQTSTPAVPLVRASASSSNFTPPRFTILPTAPTTVTTRGPTPVALIQNLASTNKPTTVSCTTTIGISTNSYSGGVRSTSVSTLARTAAQLSAKPNISITPVSRPMPTRSSLVSSSTPTPKAASSSANAGASRAQQPSNPSYVVCEICDGYIKDLDQLRNHMQWIHKVKIHPKMIHNRPPLNCQKCHFRFFTDQGLERHLLGSHGLVTSSMQENANKGKDGGRCIICGKVFLWKLVIHMAKDHKMTLKPAHLSYKCTVCSATFNMYRLFETHVYEEHSTVAKRVLDGQKSYSPLPQPSAPLPKSKVTITPSLGSSDVTIRKALAATRGAGVSVTERSKPIEVRYCTDCGEEITRTKKCVSHWEKSNLKPCDVKLCRIDVCDLCIEKADKEARAASNGKAAGGKGAKKNHVDDDCEIVEDSPPAKKKKIEVEIVSADKQTEQSDCDDIFDMEVETVDDDHQSSGDCQSEVECQSD